MQQRRPGMGLQHPYSALKKPWEQNVVCSRTTPILSLGLGTQRCPCLIEPPILPPIQQAKPLVLEERRCHRFSVVGRAVVSNEHFVMRVRLRLEGFTQLCEIPARVISWHEH